MVWIVCDETFYGDLSSLSLYTRTHMPSDGLSTQHVLIELRALMEMMQRLKDSSLELLFD